MAKTEKISEQVRVSPEDAAAARQKLMSQDAEVHPGMTADASLASRVPQNRAEAADELTADIERIRAMRKPFGAYSQKLAIPKKPGYHLHWFNDSPGRIEEALGAGWKHRTDGAGNPIKRVVGTSRDGGPLYGFAMDLPQVFWEEDMAAREERAKAPLDAIKRNPFPAQAGAAKPSDSQKFYTPEDAGGVSINRQ